MVCSLRHDVVQETQVAAVGSAFSGVAVLVRRGASPLFSWFRDRRLEVIERVGPPAEPESPGGCWGSAPQQRPGRR